MQRLKKALESLFHPTAGTSERERKCICVCVCVCVCVCTYVARKISSSVEIQIYNAKRELRDIVLKHIDYKDKETYFWKRLVSNELHPVTVRLQQTSKEIGLKLKALRNSTLALIFLINITWIILLYTVTLPQLVNYGLPERAFQLLFLAVYGFIILVSFGAMLVHRLLMLIHFLGRPEVFEEAVYPRATNSP